jgi:hypothetical protein
MSYRIPGEDVLRPAPVSCSVVCILDEIQYVIWLISVRLIPNKSSGTCDRLAPPRGGNTQVPQFAAWRSEPEDTRPRAQSPAWPTSAMKLGISTSAGSSGDRAAIEGRAALVPRSREGRHVRRELPRRPRRGALHPMDRYQPERGALRSRDRYRSGITRLSGSWPSARPGREQDRHARDGRHVRDPSELTRSGARPRGGSLAGSSRVRSASITTPACSRRRSRPTGPGSLR